MASPLQQVAVQAATRAGLDPSVFVRQINQESGFNPDARSGAGAVGIAQIVPKWHPGVDATNPVESLNWAANYMAGLVKQYGGLAPALSAYNSGSPTAYRDPGFAHGQTFNYVRDILGGSPAAVTAPGRVANAVTPGATQPNDAGAIQALLGIAEGGSPVGLLTRLANPTVSVAPAPTRNLTEASTPQTPSRTSGALRLSFVPPTLTTRTGIQVDQRILPQVLSVAKSFGVKVNSGYRSPAHNAAVGGAENSDHLGGDAVDFTGTPAQMEALHAWAVDQNFAYVEPMDQAKNHVHISFLRRGAA